MMRAFRFALFCVLAAGGVAAADLKPLPAKPAPALRLPSLGGGQTDLAALRGQVVLVNFWATWCPPCRKEMPSMNRLAEKLKGRPFTLLGVNAGEDAATIQAFIQQVPVHFPLLLDEDGASIKPWQVFVFPTSYVLDKQGRLRLGLTGSIEWDAPETVARLEALLAE